MSKDSSSDKISVLAGVYRFIPAIFITLGSALLFLAGQFIGIILFTIVLGLMGMSSNEISNLLDDSSMAKLCATFFVEAVSVGLVISFLRYAGEKPYKFLKLAKKLTLKDLKATVLAYGLYFLSFVVISTIGSVLIKSLDVDQQQQLGYGSVNGLEYLVVFVTLVVLPPIAEEILFRGFLFQSLKKTVSIKVATVLTSLVFAAAHLEFLSGNPLNWIAAIDTFVLSIFLIWLLQKTDNLWSPILLHALKNSIAFIVLFVI
jgi:membrane protease YdiL (CAAX protease family)